MANIASGQLPERKDVPKEYKWHIEDMFETDEAFMAELASFKEDIEGLSRYVSHLGDGPETLLAYYDFRESLLVRIDTLYAYAMQRSDEDTGNAHYQDLMAQTVTVYNRFCQLLSFEDPELLALADDYIPHALEALPGLAPYAHTLKTVLRQKAHTLSKEEEALMALTMDMTHAPREIFSMFNNADIRFEDACDSKGQSHALSHGRFVLLLEDQDRVLRENVFKTYYKAYEGHKNTLAAMYAANLKKELFQTRARHYDSSMSAHLAGANIPTAVYDGLIEAVHDALPEMYRYVRLRKKLLGVDELHMYDVYAPLVKDLPKTYSYEEAKAMVAEGLKPLGEDYIRMLTDGMEGGWIDVCENQGKRSGAYSGGDYAHHPYVLLNFQNNLNNVFTLAHEMGHSIHSWLANTNNNYSNACYSIFVAEIASTTNEALLMHDLLEKCTDPKEKLYLLNYYLDQFKGTVFRQTMFAEFEKITHAMLAEGKTLNAQALCEVYLALNKRYFGPEMVSDPEIAMEWARIPHFYTPFYVYQYATGFSAATAFSREILEKGPEAAENYKNFLRAGGSDDPIEVLKKAGLDMTGKKPVADALKVFASILAEAEKTLAEIEALD